MIVALPSAEAKAALLVEHAARFPEAFDFKLPVDGDEEDTLKILLGTPSKDSEAWDHAVGVSFTPKLASPDNASFVIDCLLWPDLSTWGGLVRRWPALPDRVASALRGKLGGLTSMIEGPDGEPPAIVKDELARNKSAVWRRLKVGDAPIDLAIRPPEEVLWRFFQDEISKPGAKRWNLALDFATASVVASTAPTGDVFARWPGCAMLVALTASKLSGVAAEYERGEF